MKTIFPTCDSCEQIITGTVVKTDTGVFCYSCLIGGQVVIQDTRWPNAGESGGAEL